ncbi:hypothetical protein RA8CHR_05001 [Variovorax sp. RA8]|nr:hypothetical protein RA8CHR_05001 [Variovorax sp. RA8]
MNINFDRSVIYERDDYKHHSIVSQEQFSYIVNKFMRLELGNMNDLEMLFSNLRAEINCNYLYSRTSCRIQRFIDAHVEDLPKIVWSKEE